MARRPQPEDCSPESREFLRMLDATDWTHEEAASRLGLNRVTVSNYVRGKLNPSRTVLLFMAHLTRTIVNLPEYHDTSGTVQDRGSTPQWEQELLPLLRRLPPAQRQSILAMIETIAPPITYGAKSDKAGGRSGGSSAKSTGTKK